MTWMPVSAREALDGPTADPEVVLWHFSHPDWDEDVRISTDNADLISIEPFVRGTRSAWRADPATEPFLHATTYVEMPGDRKAVPQARVAFEANVPEIVKELRKITAMATVHFAVVVASAPDVVIKEFSELSLISAEYGEENGRLIVSIAREQFEQEVVPFVIVNKDRFPGLWR
jgi:hypothetical protein